MTEQDWPVILYVPVELLNYIKLFWIELIKVIPIEGIQRWSFVLTSQICDKVRISLIVVEDFNIRQYLPELNFRFSYTAVEEWKKFINSWGWSGKPLTNWFFFYPLYKILLIYNRIQNSGSSVVHHNVTSTGTIFPIFLHRRKRSRKHSLFYLHPPYEIPNTEANTALFYLQTLIRRNIYLSLAEHCFNCCLLIEVIWWTQKHINITKSAQKFGLDMLMSF